MTSGSSGARPIRAVTPEGVDGPVQLPLLRRGDRLDGTPFVVLRLVGQGGMGEVYEAEHRELGRRCAVKVLHRDHRNRPDLATRMREEARSLAALRHRNVVDVFDLGVTDDGRPYFVMEMLEGRDLGKELARFGVFAVPAALGLLAQALDGLAASHAMGLIHRDIKPENLFVCDDGTLKVLDFGIAKATRGGAPLTGHGGVVGTARCMAPEQTTSGAIDPRTDVYAAGLVLYELVTGRGPFDDLRGNEHALRFAHCARTPEAPSRVAPQVIPAAVDEVILKAIAKSPEERFPSAEAMAGALRSVKRECCRSAARLGRSRPGSVTVFEPKGASMETAEAQCWSTYPADATIPEGLRESLGLTALRDPALTRPTVGARGTYEGAPGAYKEPSAPPAVSVTAAAAVLRRVAGAAAAVGTAMARLYR